MTEYTPNGLLFRQIHNQLEKQANNSLREQDLTMMQISVLMTLQEATDKQLSMKKLEKHFGVAQSTIAGIVSRLEQKGFVEAFCDIADKRVKVVHITPAGENCCVEAAYCMDKTEEKILQGFSSEERKVLNELLTKVMHNLK